MENLLKDIRYSVRLLVRKPGFAAVAVLTLALGIGANSTIFSIVNAVLFRSLPLKNPEQLVMVWQTNPEKGTYQNPVSLPNLTDWREQNSVFEQMAAFMPRGVTLTGMNEPEQLHGALVSVNLFSLLDANPILGRTFLGHEEKPGENLVVIISYGLWQRRFGGDPAILDKTLTLNAENYTVVGVMPPDFQFPVQGQLPIPTMDLWLPLVPDQAPQARGIAIFMVVARLRPGVPVETAQAEMSTIAGRLEQQYPESNTGAGVRLVPLHEQVVGRIKLGLLMLLAAVGFVLLITCANVTNLMLVRATARQKEVAIRTALGAARMRLVRQFLTESLVLALAGGALGFLIAFFGVKIAGGNLPSYMPRAANIRIDYQVFGFTLLVSIITGIILGLVPALRGSKANLSGSLQEAAGRLSGGPGRHRLRSLLVVSEVALALILLVGAGLLVRSLFHLQQVSPGFNAQNVLVVPYVLPPTKYPRGQYRAIFIDQVTQRINTIPDVRSIGAISILPLSGEDEIGSFLMEGQSSDPGEKKTASVRVVTPDYFTTMIIPVLNGRTFTDQDKFESPPIAIVNKKFASRYYPDEDAVNKRIKPASGGDWITIVGVVGDVRSAGLANEPKPEVYYAYLQERVPFMNLVIRTGGDPKGLVNRVRGEIWAVDSNLPLSKITTLNELLASSISEQRFNMVVLDIFAALAMVLAAIGVYGVISYSVKQRTHEIGIRMALGAQQNDVLRLVMGEGMTLALIGVGAGLVGAFTLTRVMSTLLYEVSATDPVTFAIVSLILIAVVAVASYLPARKATRVDPMMALRYE